MNMKGAVRDISKHSDVSCFFETTPPHPKKKATRFDRTSKKTTILSSLSGTLISCVLFLVFLLFLLPFFLLLFLLLISLNAYYFRKKILFSTKLHLKFTQTN